MIRVELLSEARFAAMADEWQTCLDGSEANPLFMSWPWLFSWWETWSQVLGMELILFGAFDENDKLIGIGPFCRRVLVTSAGVRVARLYLLGSAWRLASTIRTEYCGLIVHHARENEVRALLVEALDQSFWDELICTDVPENQLAAFSNDLLDDSRGYRLISRTEDVGIRIKATGTFDEWLDGLGRNTRLKAFNRRTYLRKQGELEFVEHDKECHGDFFDLLNGFHLRRWGKPAFNREALRFHRLLLSRLDLCDAQPALTLLQYRGRCVSVLYDITVGGCRYNLQAGYEENFDSKVSLGYLHLGFAIEAAFHEHATTAYDLLAGTGKKQFYKSHFNGEPVRFSTFQVVRRPLLKIMYGIQAASPPLIARAFSRRVGL